MTTHIQPMPEVNQKATDALIQAIGIVDTIRFLNQFRSGTGNYTKEREQLFEGMSVKDIAHEIKAQRKTNHC